MAGSNAVTILQSNLPNAPVSIACSSASGTTFSPSGNVLASTEDAGEIKVYGAPTASPAQMAPAMLQGGNQPLNVTNPYLAMNWCIAYMGIFPSRP
jgi:microcystin-dependent protein